MSRCIVVAALGLLLTGCVPVEKYRALQIEKNQKEEQLLAAQNEAAANRAAADAWKKQLDALMAANGDTNALTGNLHSENATLRAQLAALNEKYENALKNQVVVGGPLNEPLANALTELARQNPDVMEFDANTGMVKFKSDITFAKGSSELNPAAKSVIDRFAQILNSPMAKEYEFLVAGHTDNTPVSNPATIAAGHKDNWYLSAHRAITVQKALTGQGISPKRVGVLGYADQRPAADNTTPAGQAKNRRVEVLILPTRGATATANAATPAATVRPAATLNKDSAVIPATPVLTK